MSINVLRTFFIGLVSATIGLGVTAMATSASPAFAHAHFAPVAVSVL